MTEAKVTGEGAAVSEPGSAGPLTKLPGFLAYFEVSKFFNKVSSFIYHLFTTWGWYDLLF